MSPEALSPTTLIRRKPGLLASESDDITVMFIAEKGQYCGLEAVGSRIWQLLEDPISVADLCTKLQAEYDVSPEQCERETLDFIRHLHAADLISVSDVADR